MKLNLTKDEYRLLLDLVYLGDWMVSAHDEKIDAKEPSKYEALVQKVLSCASETEFATLVERSADDGKFYTTRQFEEDGVMNIIYEYDEESFWMELIDRLAERDIRAAQPDGHLPPFKEYLELAGPIEEKYAQEFESHGLQRLQLPPDA
jgi:hypothetical protein